MNLKGRHVNRDVGFMLYLQSTIEMYESILDLILGINAHSQDSSKGGIDT